MDVLVVGDVMIDRSWVVSGRVQDTVQAHDDVKPNKRHFPDSLADRLGGAGITAAALSHISDLAKLNVKVNLLGLFDPPDRSVIGKIIPHHLLLQNGEMFTTIKWRVYGLDAREKPHLRLRFDQDPPEDMPSKISTELPSSISAINPCAVVISDFNKGVAQPALIKNIIKKFPTTLFFVDTKNHLLFKECRELRNVKGTLFVNRDEARKLYQVLRPGVSPPDISDSLSYCRFEVLRLGGVLADHLPNWDIIIKLDREGSFIFSKGEAFQVPVPTLSAPGIAAGDFFLAGWVVAILKGETNIEKTSSIATQVAFSWVEYSDSTEAWRNARNNRREMPIPQDLAIKELDGSDFTVVKLGETEEAEKVERKKLLYPGCLESNTDGGSQLILKRAKCGLGSFLVVEPNLRRDLRNFVSKISSYLKGEGEARPLNCAITANPGTGKSFLLREVSSSLGAKFHEVNVGQCSSISELLEQFASIAGQGHAKRIIMLDEVDSTIGGQKVYQALLAPLWDGKVLFEKREWDLGRRFVAVLIASQPQFFENLRQEGGKGIDLWTRLKGPKLRLRSPEDNLTAEERALDENGKCRADYAYMIASIIRRYHGDVHWISREVLDTLCQNCLPPRDLEYLLSKLESPDDSWIRVQDFCALLERENEFKAQPSETSDSQNKIDVIFSSLKPLMDSKSERRQRVEIIDG